MYIHVHISTVYTQCTFGLLAIIFSIDPYWRIKLSPLAGPTPNALISYKALISKTLKVTNLSQSHNNRIPKVCTDQ